MKQSIRAYLRAFLCVLLLLQAWVSHSARAQTFVHPGAFSTQADFDRMKAEVASGQWPWYDSYQTLSNDWLCSLGHVWNHIPIIYRDDPTYGSNFSYAQTDAICIYYCALKYRITGDTRYAEKAIEGMDVWSSTLTREPLGNNGMLAVGLCGYEFAVAGETLRGYPGWSQTSIDNYKKMLGLFAPVSANYLNLSGPHPRSNWLTDNMACLIACAVFCDNQDWFNQAVNYYKYGAPTPGYSGNGHLYLWAWFLHPEGIVQMEESGRDQAHCDDALSTMATFCQIAANQGVDLFGYDNNRFLRGAEYFAKYNLGNNVPFTAYFNGVGWPGGYYETVVSQGARGSVFFIWDMINNHFIQKGIYAPYTAAYAARLRPSGSGEYWNSPDSFGYDTLTHYQVPPATDYPPSGLMVNFNSRKATVSWFGSLRATSYNVKRSTVSGGPYTTIATTGSMTCNYVDDQVPRGSTYYYVVSAVTPSGETANTPEAIAGCVTRYNFNGDASDSVGSLSGTLACSGSSGLPGFTTGLNGSQALLLNGTDQYVQLPVGTFTHQDITISTWVKWGGGNAYQMVFDTSDPNINRRMFLTVSDGSRMRFYITDDWHSYDATLYGPPPTVNTWTHVAVTIKQDAATLYENGVPVDTEWVGTCPLFGTAFINIGKSMYASDPCFNGAIQDFRIYNTALAGTEIYNLWGQGTNHAPQFASDPMTLPEAWDSVPYTGHSVIQKASDVDGGTLTFSKVGGAAWVKVGANGELSGTPGTGDVGVNVVNIRVTDPLGATDDATFYITVNNVNQPPAWSSSTMTLPSINQNQPYSSAGVTLSGSATDPDTYLGDTMSFSKVSGPAWLIVDPSGALSGTPGAGDTGLNTFTVRATDASGASADATLYITVVPFSLRSQYQFEGDLNDSVSGFNGAVVGYPTYVAGRTGQAMAFNGLTDCVKLPAGVATYREITVAAWVYWNGGAAWQRIFDFGDDTTHYMNLTPYSGSAMRFAINNGGGDQTITTTTMPTGRWTHVALTLSGSTATLYVNGTVAGSNTAITVSPADISPSNNLIGDSQFASDPFLNGKIDDFRIYNYALSASDISSLIGSVTPLTPTGLTATGGNGYSQVTLSWSAAFGAASYNVKRASSPNGTYTTIYSGSATSFTDTTATPGVTYYYIVTAVDAGGESAASSSVSEFVSSSTPRVYLRMDELSGTTASDSSANGWNGTLVGGSTWVAGKINNAVSLSGSSNYVSLPSGVVTSMTNCTVSAWVKINSLSTWARIFDIGTATNNYMFLAPSSGAGKARFAIRTPSIGEQQISSSTIVSPTGAWTHFAVTLSGSVGTLYINGTVAGTNSAMTLNPTSLGTTTLNYIGKSQFSDPYLNGLVDEFQIYPRALSAAEIGTLVASISAPTGVTIASGTAQATVSWNPVVNATGYNLKRSGTSGGPYTVVQANVSGTTATDSGLINSGSYYYVVTALNGVGESVNSSEVSTTTAAGAPPTPAGLQASGTDSLVSLTWTPSYGATSYNVLRSTTSGTGYVLTGTSATASYSDNTVTNGIAYYYVVNAVGPNGQSANSSEASALPMGIPGLVTGLTATGTWGAAILSWNPTPSAFYNIRRTQTSGTNYLAPITVSGTTGFVEYGLTNGVTYYYIISAQNAVGQGPWSAEVRVTPVASPATPTAYASGNNGQVGVVWGGVSGATSYSVKRSGTSGGPYTVIYSGTTTRFFDQSVSNGTPYYYIVTASNAGGESSPSSERMAIPSSTPFISYLRFDELSGTTASDATGHGWNGTLVGAATWTAGKINNAVSFSGSSNYATLPAGVMGGLKDYTISAWVKMNTATNWARIFDFGTGTGNYLMLCPRAGSAGNYLRLETVTGGVVQQINTTYSFPTGTWIHVAVTLSGSTGTLYVNGTAAGTNAAMTLNPSSLGGTTLNYIGKSQWAADPYFNGLVDEFKIYGRALSASEISAQATPLAAPTSLTATAGNSQITCNWSAVSAAAYYNLKRAYVNGGPYTMIATVTGTTYTDTTTVPESPYFYIVTSGSGVVESANSMQASATPAMAVPVITSATAASGTNGSAFSYQITASNVVNSFGATGLPSGLNLDSGSGIISGTPSVSGTFSVGLSASSDVGTGNATLTLTLQPPAPVINSGLAQTGTSGSAFSYTITASNNPTSFGASGLPTGLSVNATSGVISGTPSVTGAFSVTLSASNGGGTGSANLQLLLLSGSFGAPTGLGATAGNGAVSLAWNPVVGASTYNVKRTLTSGSNYTTVATGVSSPSYPDSGLTNRTAYYYVVSAVTSGGTESANSSEAGAIPMPPLTWVGGGVDVNWQTPGNWSSQPVAGNPLSFEGNLRLSNTNNYPVNTQFGAITFNSGAGAFSLSGNDLNLAGDIVNNSGTAQTINLNLALAGANRTINAASAAITLAGVISQSGGTYGLIKTGTGALTLYGANTFRGPSVLNQGILNVENNMALGTGTLTLAGGTLRNSTNNGGTRILYNPMVLSAGTTNFVRAVAADLVFNGNISGSGTLDICGTYNVAGMRMGGDDSGFTGTVNIAGPNLRLDSPYAASANAAWIVGVSGTGGMMLNAWGPGNTFQFGSLSGNGRIAGHWNNSSIQVQTLSVGALGTDSTFAGSIVDNEVSNPAFGTADGAANNVLALTKVGAGTLTLSGSNPYSGPTNVNAGTLKLNGILSGTSAVTVNSGGTLAGIGTSSGPVTVSSGGTIVPGDSGAGTLSINGDLALNDGSILNVQLSGTGISDQLSLGAGVISTGTTTLNVAALSGFGEGTYPVITGTAPISAANFAIGTVPAGYGCILSASNGVLSVTSILLPQAPTGLIATPGDTLVNLSWDATPTATSYNVKRSTTSGSGYVTIASGTSTSFSDTGLTNGTTYYYLVSATNTGGEGPNSSEASAMPVPPPPVISSATSATGTNGSGFSYVITASNSPTSYAASGLPTGLSVDTSTGIVSGTPTVTGTFNVNLSATNLGGTGTATLTLTVLPPPPVITSAASATGTNGTAFSYTILATTSPTSFAATGLPTGLTLNTSTGLINGTPTVTGTFTVSLSASNAGGTGTGTLTITVLPTPPSITSALSATGTSGSIFSYQIAASNSPTSYAASGLPAGLSLNTNTGLISGTPSATGTTSVTISASNAGGTGRATLTITVVPPAPVITSGLSASGTTGVAFSYSIAASNSPTSYGASGLPAGLSVNTSTGLISGTPTTTGTTSVTISASNAGGTGSATLTITVVPPAPVISSGLSASGTTGVAFSYSIAATNSPTSYAASGLPAGLSVDTSTGLISGTPSATGTTSVTISASNAGGTGSATLTVTILPPPPVITSAAVATGTYANAFSYTITASNSPTSFGATGLPTGLSLNTSTGLISGTPVVTGTYSATVSASNAGGTGSAPLTISVGSLVNNTWTGGGSNALWQTSANWTTLPVAGNPLYFAGSLQLSNTNDFAAGTQFASIAFNSGAGAFTLNGNSFALGGAISQNSANLQTINNAINLNNTGGSVTHTIGSGGLTLNGSLSNSSNIRTITFTGGGTLTLNGTTTWNFGGADYSSPYLNGVNLTIGSGGVLTVNGAANNFSGYFNVAGSSTVSVLSGGALTVNGRTASVSTTNLGAGSGDNVVFNISGSVTYGDGNNLQLGGNANGHGTMNINSGGILSLVNASRTMAIATNGIINLNSGGTLASARTWSTGAGTFALNGGTFKAMANQSLPVATSITTTSTTTTIDANSYAVSIPNAISGTGGLIVASGSGTGTVTLSGTSTYTESTRVSSGTLNLLGVLSGSSAVKVDAGATLAGTGNAAGTTTVTSGGVIAPGNGGTGTLRLGNLTLNDGAVLNLELSGTGSSDKVAVGGAVSASGTTTLNLTALSGFGPGTYPLISATSALNAANFTVGTAPSGYGYALSASGGGISVTVVVPPTAPTGLTATAGDSVVNLSWAASSGATSYNVKRSLTSGGTYTTVATGTATTYTDSGLTNGTAYYYVVSASNIAGESANSTQASGVPTNNTTLPRFSLSGDIGTTGATGTTSLVSGTYTMQGAGADIWGTADAFQFMYQKVTGDCDVRVRVLSVQNTNVWAKAGVMIRNTLDAGSQFADAFVSPSSGVAAQWRSSTNGTCGGAGVSGLAAPYWVRLVRSGSTFTYYDSADGTTWSTLTSNSIAMNSTVYVGLAVTAHVSGTLCTATMDNFSVVALPSPWSSSDIGTVGSAGSATYSGSTYTMAGSGADISGTSDAFRFAYQTSTGDCDITARVSDLSVSDASAKAVVMVRESLNANSLHAMVVVTPSSGISFQWRSVTGNTTSTTVGPSLTAPCWIRLVRSGSTFTGYYSADGSTWTSIGSTTITMASSANIGLGVTSHSDGVLCTATFDNVTANP